MFKTISIDVIWNFEKDKNAEMAEEFLQEHGIKPLKNGLRSLILAFHLSFVLLFNLKDLTSFTPFCNPFPPCKPSHCIRERLTLYAIKILIIDHSLFFAMMFMQQKGKEGALQPALAKVFGFVIRTRLILTQC